jgi:hypothetical protein
MTSSHGSRLITSFPKGRWGMLRVLQSAEDMCYSYRYVLVSAWLYYYSDSVCDLPMWFLFVGGAGLG